MVRRDGRGRSLAPVTAAFDHELLTAKPTWDILVPECIFQAVADGTQDDMINIRHEDPVLGLFDSMGRP